MIFKIFKIYVKISEKDIFLFAKEISEFGLKNCITAFLINLNVNSNSDLVLKCGLKWNGDKFRDKQ